MGQFIFDLMVEGDYENIIFCQETTLCLKAIIAIARAQHISTDRAAVVLVEQRIALVRQVKGLADHFQV